MPVVAFRRSLTAGGMVVAGVDGGSSGVNFGREKIEGKK